MARAEPAHALRTRVAGIADKNRVSAVRMLTGACSFTATSRRETTFDCVRKSVRSVLDGTSVRSMGANISKGMNNPQSLLPANVNQPVILVAEEVTLQNVARIVLEKSWIFRPNRERWRGSPDDFKSLPGDHRCARERRQNAEA
jgi:hypothetical protein